MTVAFAENLRKIISEKGLSIPETSRRIGVDKRTVSYYISGERQPKISDLDLIADALKVSVADLVCPHEQPRLSTGARFSATETLPVHGVAACSVQGWGKAQQQREPAPAPAAPGAAEAFWVVAAGQSMRPDGVHHLDWCLISTTASAQPGDRVWIRASDGASVKRLMAMDDHTITLRGWLPQDDKGAQREFVDIRQRSGVAELRPVIAVFPHRPKPGEPAAQRPDPHAPAKICAARLAAAIGAPETATADELISLAEKLRRRAAIPDKIREAAALIAAWHEENEDKKDD